MERIERENRQDIKLEIYKLICSKSFILCYVHVYICIYIYIYIYIYIHTHIHNYIIYNIYFYMNIVY